MAQRSSAVPEGTLSRLAGLGAMVGSFALGGLAEGARRLVGRSDSKSNIFLTAANAATLARRLSRMRGAAMKLGQLLSLQGADLVAAERQHLGDQLAQVGVVLDDQNSPSIPAVVGRARWFGAA